MCSCSGCICKQGDLKHKTSLKKLLSFLGMLNSDRSLVKFPSWLQWLIMYRDSLKYLIVEHFFFYIL